VIANTAVIDDIHEHRQRILDPLRGKLNKLLGKKWEEWEIPREPEQRWKAEAQTLLDDWWKARRARQQEIDAAIAKHADFETLYDQPYEDSKRIRVSGPFTVESLSPHRVLPAADEMAKRPEKAIVVGQSDTRGTADFAGPTYKAGDAAQDAGNFVSMLIENMRRAGVKGAKKDQRIAFDRLEAYAGTWIHAEGEFTDADGKSKRVAVCIGPEFGTVGSELLKEAAKEAVQGIGFDVLLVCGFAFDPHVSEEAHRYGKLTVLPTRMNPDLAMGDELLKKTGAGNLFMVFGEPDVDIKKGKDGKITVEIKGVDVYDPTTGQIRSNSTEDIACWFIDTSYNGESFFVRHAYFTGADKPFERLQKALRAELNSEAWASIYSTKSRPFDLPKTGKIAIKVINHYGDEVLKVFETGGAK
jgi:adenine-specific DNA-methyltransferase